MRATILFFVIVSGLYLSACSPSFKLKPGAEQIGQVAICPQYQDYIDEDIHLALQELTREIIRDYPGRIHLSESSADAEHRLKIYFENTDITDTKGRNRAMIISLLGTALPIYLILVNSPIWFPIWIFPWNTSVYKLDLESGGEAGQQVIRGQARTLNLSGDRRKQIERQKNKIKKQVFNILRKLEEDTE